MEPGTEPPDWMWLGTREVLLAGWNADEYEKIDIRPISVESSPSEC